MKDKTSAAYKVSLTRERERERETDEESEMEHARSFECGLLKHVVECNSDR